MITTEPILRRQLNRFKTYELFNSVVGYTPRNYLYYGEVLEQLGGK